MSRSKSFKKLLERMDTPEYKQECIERTQKYLDNLTMDYQLGYFVGEYIVNRYLPTLSTDLLKSNRVIEVTEEESLENKRLNEDWFSSTTYSVNHDGPDDGNDDKWRKYLEHNKMLEKKYLPNPLECYIQLIKLNDEIEFRKGLRFSLWNCDRCQYNIENYTIQHNLELMYTKITFNLDENN
jgi:hypothetical protein